MLGPIGAFGQPQIGSGAVVTVTGAYMANAGVRLIIADTSNTALTVTLPQAAANPGGIIKILKKDSSTNVVTIAVTGGDSVGTSIASLSTQRESVELISDGRSIWYVTSHSNPYPVIVSSTSSGAAQSTGNTGATDITNLSLSITTSGRPVRVGLYSDGSGNSSTLSVGSAKTGFFFLIRGSTQLAQYAILTDGVTNVPSAGVQCVDVVAAGTYTYKAQFAVSAGGTVTISRAVLTAYEI